MFCDKTPELVMLLLHPLHTQCVARYTLNTQLKSDICFIHINYEKPYFMMIQMSAPESVITFHSFTVSGNMRSR